MKRAFAANGLAIFAASAPAQSAPSTADFVKTVAISDMFESCSFEEIFADVPIQLPARI
jgi:hypothetical protein